MYSKLATGMIALMLLTAAVSGCQAQTNKDGEVYYGTVEASQINISSEIAGTIQEIKVTDGQSLEKDTVIAVLSAGEKELRLKQAELNLKLAENELDRIKDDSRLKDTNAQTAAELAVEQAKVALELTKLGQQKNEVKSVVEGIVDTVNYEAGEYVIPGSAIATVNDPKDLCLKVFVPEKMLENLELNQDVTLNSDFVEGDIKGKIAYISSKAEYTPMNIVTKSDREKLVFEVRIQIAEKQDKIKAGMLLDVHF